jgi:hypothetical protein
MVVRAPHLSFSFLFSESLLLSHHTLTGVITGLVVLGAVGTAAVVTIVM